MDFDTKFIFSYLYLLIIALSTKAEECKMINACSCSTPQYTIDLQPLVTGKNPRFEVSAGGYTYSYEPCVGISGGCAESTAPVAVCQEETVSGAQYNAGFQSSATFSGDAALNNLKIQYTGPQTTPVRSSTIHLLCNQGPVDSFVFNGEQGQGTGKFDFTLTTKYACPSLPPSPAPGHHGLSTGSILLILFFVFLAVYFIGGILFLKFVRGAQGTELIPNLEFWTVLPGLIKFACTICANVTFPKYHRAQRYVQEKHSGFNFQCLKCKKLFSRKNYKHGCANLENNDLDLLSPKGVRGEEAFALFRQCKNEVQPTLIKDLMPKVTTVQTTAQKRKLTDLDLKEFEMPGRISPLPPSPKRKSNKFDRGTDRDMESDSDSEISENGENGKSENCEQEKHMENEKAFDKEKEQGEREVEAIMNSDGPELEVDLEKELPGVVFEPPVRILTSESIPSSGLCAKIESFKKAQGQKIVLNIGGVHFECSRESLTKDPKSLFVELFKKDSSLKPAVGNQYFFDRDPAHFRFILNYLRNGCRIDIRTLPKDVRYLYELFYEAEYYNLHKLMEAIVAKIEQVNVVSSILPGGSKSVFQMD